MPPLSGEDMAMIAQLSAELETLEGLGNSFFEAKRLLKRGIKEDSQRYCALLHSLILETHSESTVAIIFNCQYCSDSMHTSYEPKQDISWMSMYESAVLEISRIENHMEGDFIEVDIAKPIKLVKKIWVPVDRHQVSYICVKLRKYCFS